MRDVEKPGVLTRPIVLGHDAGRIVNGHLIAGEGHHLRAKRDMRFEKCRLVERCFGEAVCHGVRPT